MTRLVLFGLFIGSLLFSNLHGGGSHLWIYDDHCRPVFVGDLPEHSDAHDHTEDLIAAEQSTLYHAAINPIRGGSAMLPANLLALAPPLPPPKAV